MRSNEGWTGRFYEDFEVGDVYRSPLGRTVTEADNVWFTLLTMNTNQAHFNSHAAVRSPFERPLVNSTFTLAVVLGLTVIDTSQNAFANLGWEKIELPAPVFVGDTLYAETAVLERRESQSRPWAGIVKVLTRGLNQRGEVVLSYVRSFYIHKRSSPHRADAAFPEAAYPITEDVDGWIDEGAPG